MTVESRQEPLWVDLAISRLLRGGVVLSIAIVIFGVTVTFAHHPAYFSSRPALGELTSAAEAYPHTIPQVVEGVRGMRGQAIATVGLLLLIATPVARVAFSIVVFAIERDRLYVAITIVVLMLLLASFVLGTGG